MPGNDGTARPEAPTDARSADANASSDPRAPGGKRSREGDSPSVTRLAVWKPADPAAALGAATAYLSRMPAFAQLQFGEWSRTLYFQVERGHYVFVVDGARRARGFLGWALTRRELAELWLEGLSGLRNDDCREGECVIINAWAADDAAANAVLAETAHALFAAKESLYFKRFYPDGRSRPSRIKLSAFAAAHAARRFAR